MTTHPSWVQKHNDDAPLHQKGLRSQAVILLSVFWHGWSLHISLLHAPHENHECFFLSYKKSFCSPLALSMNGWCLWGHTVWRYREKHRSLQSKVFVELKTKKKVLSDPFAYFRCSQIKPRWMSKNICASAPMECDCTQTLGDFVKKLSHQYRHQFEPSVARE